MGEKVELAGVAAAGDPRRLRLGLSACLLGERVRWNGGHRREEFLTDVVSTHADLVPFCPENAVLGTPRPTVRLERKDSIRLVMNDGSDYTEAVEAETPKLDVHGYILKRGSPTCGLDNAVWQEGKQKGRAPGVVAAKLIDLDIPVTDEGRLREPNWREHFFDQAFCWLRWGMLEHSTKGLMDWHGKHKLTLMAHSPQGTKELGQLAASGDVDGYRAKLPEVLKTQSTRGRHANVLDHIQGYVSKELDSEDRAELKKCIEDYQGGYAPLLVPVTMLRHYARKYAPLWLLEQTYLDPYPAEWVLRA